MVIYHGAFRLSAEGIETLEWEKPDPAVVLRAIEIYIGIAFGANPPSAISAVVDRLRIHPRAEFYRSACFERPPDADPGRFSLRLGNRNYQHMKLVVERAPSGRGFLLRVDTHDLHACPDPGAGEYGSFRTLMALNRSLAQEIEAAWDREGLPTFKTFLKNDLERRRVT